MTETETDRQTDRQTDRETDRQRDRQRETDRANIVIHVFYIAVSISPHQSTFI